MSSTVSFPEALHLICRELGYSQILADQVLHTAMATGELNYSRAPIIGSDGCIIIIDDSAPSENSVFEASEFWRFVDSRQRPRVNALSNDILAGELQDNGEASGWPWGSHETRLLRHLAEAAHQWWSTYDPDDLSTAPTNEEVAAWLGEREVSKRVAQIMAQILRADGIPTGPRK